MRVIVFGANGYIGSEIYRQLEAKGHTVYSCPARNKDGSSYGFWDLNDLLHTHQPAYVVNCIANTGGGLSVSQCEWTKTETIFANVIFPKMLAESCEYNDVTLCHFSTGCLYNGYDYTGNGFKETDAPNMTFHIKDGKNACCFYTGTKVMAEEQIDFLEEKFVWRIRLPFEEKHGVRNYLSKLMFHSKLVDTPNSIAHKEELVEACVAMMEMKAPFGTYHVVNPFAITAREITDMMKKYLHLPDDRFTFFDSLEEFNKLGDIPRSNTTLSTDKLQSLGIHMRPVREAVEETLKKWRW